VVVGSVEALASRPVDADGIVFRRDDRPGDLPAIGRPAHRGLGRRTGPGIGSDLEGRIARLGPDGFRVLVAESAGRSLRRGGSSWRGGSEFASLWGGSTLEAFRAGGHDAALVASAVDPGSGAGYSFCRSTPPT